MRKALMSTAVAVCGALGAAFAGSAQANQVGFSVNINVPLNHGGFYGGVPVQRQVVFVQQPVVFAPPPVVFVSFRSGFRHGHHGHRQFNNYRGNGHGRGGYRY